MNYCWVYITCSNEAEAETIATEIVSSKLAACANIIPSIKSIYEWEGKIQNETESILLLKTDSKLFDQITKKVSSLHSYDIPAIIKISWQDASAEFQLWMEKSLSVGEALIE